MEQDRLLEIRAHEMYRVLLSTSPLYNKKLKELLESSADSERNNLISNELHLISEVFAEICGVKRDHNGVV